MILIPRCVSQRDAMSLLLICLHVISADFTNDVMSCWLRCRCKARRVLIVDERPGLHLDLSKKEHESKRGEIQ